SPTSAPAAAPRARILDLQPISGYSPFKSNGCGVPGTPTFDSEAEPSIAVNPKDPTNLVAVWQQDRFASDGGALSNIAGVSRDGGRTWRSVLIPKLSRCTGGADERTSDPWLTIGPDGTTYLASLTFTDNPVLAAGGLAGPTNQVVSRSTDGGSTWANPVTVINNGAYNDRQSIIADPFRPATAYEVWVDRLGAFGETGVNKFVSTGDGGRTFSSPLSTYIAAPANLPDPTLVDVLRDGTLVNVFMLANISAVVGPKMPFQVMAMRSVDHGKTWSTPVKIAELPPLAPYDSDTNVQVRAFPDVSTATAPDGTLYVVWNDIQSERRSSIRLSRSLDEGVTWSAPTDVRDLPAQAFLPSVAVDKRGVIGVMWDDFRHHKPGEKTLKTDVYFSASTDGGHTFRETHVAGPFDASSASATSSTGVAGRFLGDYQGFAALPSGFAAAFAQSGHTRGPSDIYFARIKILATESLGIRLQIRPRRTVADCRTRFTFTATSTTGRRVPGALIRIAGRRLKTSRQGSATATLTFNRPGNYRVLALFAGLRTGRATIRVIPQPPKHDRPTDR
ncbi:MAG TPA: sialidase family protein, partial [Solirubrobacteraceae bacterium]|nr:sialidase family protein [Solirubrobacteraceae bacterium]